ncbi:zinc finger protein 271-like [Cydia pomonella]|uniref:zinc finger protein 271-like n=1 Tax=Cydia pomonella TaxID=82600 RepID=UPI002ADE86AA|nr:zinc finger protein 271-like [Cydia pomonella]
MESTLQDTEEVFIKAEPPEDVCVQKASCEDLPIKVEPSYVNDESLGESVSIEIEVSLDVVSIKHETDDTAAGNEKENNELLPEPARGPEPAVEQRIIATKEQSPKKKSSGKPKIFKCAHCKYETVNRVCLVRHMRKNCDEKSSNKSCLRVLERHRTVNKFKCELMYAGTSKSNLLHEEIHDVQLYKCNQCSYACTQQDDLLKHKIVHTVKPSNPQRKLQVLERKNTKEKAYKCSFCSNAFCEEVSLQVHERKHTGEKPFKCDQCSYAGTQINHLLLHKAMHTYVNPYKCDQCKFACAKNDDLLKHKVIHDNVQPYKCDKCSFATDRKWNLQVHETSHTGKKAYKCSICSYTTVRKNNLVKHEARHAVKRFKCEKCSFACNRQFQLKNHERIHDEKLNKRIPVTHARNGLSNHLSTQEDSAEDQPVPPLDPVQDK